MIKALVLIAALAPQDSAEISVSTIDLATGRETHINADVVMHAASTMKVPVMMEVFRQAERGRLKLDDRIVIRNRFQSIADTSHYSLSPDDDSELELYKLEGKGVTIRDLTRRMIVRSSNLATNILIDVVKAENVRATLAEIDASGMTVMRGVEDIPAFRKGMNNTTTSRGLARALAAIARCQGFSRASCDEMMEILSGQEFNEMIPAGLPPGTRVAHKTGWITGIRHDGGIVFPPGRAPYVIVILTRGFKAPEEADRIGAEISKGVWGR